MHYGFVVFRHRQGNAIAYDWRCDGQALPKGSEPLYMENREGEGAAIHGFAEDSCEGVAIQRVTEEAREAMSHYW